MRPPDTGRPPEPPRQPPRRHDGRRSGSSPVLWIVLLVLLVGGGVTGVLIANPFGHPAPRQTAGSAAKLAAPGGSSASTGPGSASPGSGTATGQAVTEQQAAANVAALLTRSVPDRVAIGGAATDVRNCGPNLKSDPKVFDDAASSRKSLLASLAALPGRAALPPALISDLSQAWQASVAADQAYSRWAGDEIAKGCVQNDTNDPGYRATVTPNASATKYKTAFAAGWNPIAARYGLKQYKQDQL